MLRSDVVRARWLAARASAGRCIAAASMSAAALVTLVAASAKAMPAVAFARAEVAYYAASLPTDAASQCYGPAGNPAPGTDAWQQRDAMNMYCATLRLRDQVDSPAFNFGTAAQSPGVYGGLAQEQVADLPGHIHGGVPDFNTDDPFRTISRWRAAGLGRVTSVNFTAADGAQL